MKHHRPKAIDLFCGVGGLGLGVEQAGFDVVGAFDSQQFNVDSHSANFPSTRTFKADLSKVSGRHLLELSGARSTEVDLVVGGPPCQGFSVGGKRDLNDARNLLMYEFARLVREIRPKYFVMENVQGLTSSHARPVLESFVRRVKRNGYRVVEPIQVLDAANFGVPQRRKRVFVLGYRKDLIAPVYPDAITPVDGKGIRRRITVKDAISDLPKIEHFDALFKQDFFIKRLPVPRRKYARILSGHRVDESDLSLARSRPDVVTGFLRTDHTSITKRRFHQTKPGKCEPVSRYIRLAWESVSPTLRAGTGPDRGRHTAPRPIHPDSPRCITTREAARLHSFPDWFVFHGTRWHDFRQIGNSVPPMLARAVAAEIRTALVLND